MKNPTILATLICVLIGMTGCKADSEAAFDTSSSSPTQGSVLEKYAAVAFDRNGDLYTQYGEDEESSASTVVLERCEQKSSDCKLLVSGKGQKIYVAYSYNQDENYFINSNFAAIITNDETNRGTQKVIDECEQGGYNCKIWRILDHIKNIEYRYYNIEGQFLEYPVAIKPELDSPPTEQNNSKYLGAVVAHEVNTSDIYVVSNASSMETAVEEALNLCKQDSSNSISSNCSLVLGKNARYIVISKTLEGSSQKFGTYLPFSLEFTDQFDQSIMEQINQNCKNSQLWTSMTDTICQIYEVYDQQEQLKYSYQKDMIFINDPIVTKIE